MKKKKVTQKAQPEKEKFLKELGKRVRKIRLSKGLTQTQVGNKMDSDLRTIRRIEKAEINASIFLVNEIANALEVSIEELLNGMGKF